MFDACRAMAWEGMVPAVLVGLAVAGASVGLEAIHKLSHHGRVRRVSKDAFDYGLDERDARLVREGVLSKGPVYGVNEQLLLGKQ